MIDITHQPAYERPSTWQTDELIDCDVHIEPPSWGALFPYLSTHWRRYIDESGMGPPLSNIYPPHPATFLPGSTPTGGPPGSDLGLLQRQLLDPWQVDLAVVNSTYAIDALHNDDLAAALATAINRWQAEQWLQADRRLRGSAVLAVQNPQLAVDEIERVAADDAFVQVILPVRAREPLGRRGFWPIYRAAARHGLVAAVQAGGSPGLPSTPVGWPTTFLEDYVGLIEAFQAQLVSLVTEGVFTELTDLTVVLLDSGFTWLPSLLWRLDKNWKGLRREVPWVKDFPSEIVAQHIRIAAQPLDAPDQPEQLRHVIDQFPAEQMLLFATDYPHAPFSDPAESVPAGLPRSMMTALLSATARSTYRFEGRSA